MTGDPLRSQDETALGQEESVKWASEFKAPISKPSPPVLNGSITSRI
jgi:hypothetical protein